MKNKNDSKIYARNKFPLSNLQKDSNLERKVYPVQILVKKFSYQK